MENRLKWSSFIFGVKNREIIAMNSLEFSEIVCNIKIIKQMLRSDPNQTPIKNIG